MKRFSQTLKVMLALFVATFSNGLIPAAQASAFQQNHYPPQNQKVTICHRTASVTNPYVSIKVDQSSVDGNTGNDNGQGDHYAEHTGLIFPQTGSDGKWGDIIPPVAGHNGLNWTTDGQAIYNNDCTIPQTSAPVVSYDVTPCKVGTDGTDDVVISITNTHDISLATVTYTVKLGAQTKTVVVADGATSSVTFTGLAAGTYSASINGSDDTKKTLSNIVVNECNAPKAPIVKVTGTTCSVINKAKGSVTISVTNPSDKSGMTVTYTVTVGAQSKNITLADGATGSLTFTGVAAGNLSIEVTGSDGTKTCVDATVETCPVVAPCADLKGSSFVNVDTQFADYNGFDIVNGQDTRSKGHYSFDTDGLHIWTEDTSGNSKVAWYHAVNYALNEVGTPSMDYTATTGITPGLQLVIDFNGDGSAYGMLVGESVYGDNWWLTNGSDASVKAGAPNNGGGNGSQWYGNLNEWLAAFPNAKVKAVGFSLGSGVHASGVLHSITFGCFKWEFGLKEAYAQAPKFTDRCGAGNDTVWIPFVKGVVYKINGQVVGPGYHSVNKGWVIVTAEAKDGYSLKGQSKWAKCFTNNADCVTITKEFSSYADTNNDGVVSVGDKLTWTITVTNNSKNKLDNFKVVLEDSTATLDGDGVIKSLKPGDVVELTATSIINSDDMKACKATNTVSFSAWYNHRHYMIERDGQNYEFSSLSSSDKEAVLSGSAEDAFPFTCPTPGSGNGGETTTTTTTGTPATLPATGPSDSSNPLLVLAAAAIAYGATYFIQRRRELASN